MVTPAVPSVIFPRGIGFITPPSTWKFVVDAICINGSEPASVELEIAKNGFVCPSVPDIESSPYGVDVPIPRFPDCGSS